MFLTAAFLCPQKGNVEQLSSVLQSQLLYKPGVAPEDPWEEHIELDFDESGEGEGEGHWDTQSLLGAAPPTPYDPPIRDDDSGRASCCEPDLPDTPDCPHPPLPPAFYTQVGQVTQGGVVVLASGPEEGGKEKEEEEEGGMKRKPRPPVMGGYTSESDALRLRPHPAPSLDYTLVTDVNEQSNLLLNLAKPLPLAPAAQSGPAPAKPLPPPAGYLSPDLLPSITP